MKVAAKPLFFILATMLYILGCSSVDSEDLTLKLELLKDQNEVLKRENDSLKFVLNSEIFSPVVFANRYNGFETTSNELEFIVSLSYFRKNLINAIAFDVFSSEDSLEYALFENKELLSKKISPDSFDGVFIFESKDYLEGDNYFGGVFSVNSDTTKEIPFRFKFNYKK